MELNDIRTELGKLEKSLVVLLNTFEESTDTFIESIRIEKREQKMVHENTKDEDFKDIITRVSVIVSI